MTATFVNHIRSHFRLLRLEWKEKICALRVYFGGARLDLQPRIQLDNVSVAIATAEQHEAVPPACVMDIACGNVQS